MKELTEQQKKAAIEHMQGREPKFHKGACGKKFDYHTCGSCGAIITVIADYCQKCGTRILWSSPKCLSGADE